MKAKKVKPPRSLAYKDHDLNWRSYLCGNNWIECFLIEIRLTHAKKTNLPAEEIARWQAASDATVVKYRKHCNILRACQRRRNYVPSKKHQ